MACENKVRTVVNIHETTTVLRAAKTAGVALLLFLSLALSGVFSGSASTAIVMVAKQQDNVPTALWRHPDYHVVVVVTAQTYTIRPGDSLSKISVLVYGKAADWPVLYYGNRTIIKWANQIFPEQVLTVPALPGRIPAAPIQLQYSSPQHSSSPGKAYGVTYGDPNYCGDGDGDGWDIACQIHVSAPVPQYHAISSDTTYNGSGSMQRCIISRESGGNSQVMNSTGHYGLYQFSYSTWVGSGGSAADFGHASVAEQNQVFYNAVAARGYSDWVAYDGC